MRSVRQCPTCAVDLTSGTAARVWDLSLRAAALLTERAQLVERLRQERGGGAAPVQADAPSAGWSVPGMAAAPQAAGSPAAGPSPVPAAATPGPEWTRRRTQNLLLSLGVGLLAVAAVIFLVVSWSLLGIGGRASVMVACTVLAGVAAAMAHRRELGATAEALSLLTVGLALLDAWGAREAGLAGFEQGDGLVYWAGALAVVGAAGAATARVVPTRALRVSAAVLAQLPVPLLTAHVAEGADNPVVLVATGLTLSTLGALGAAAAWPTGSRSRDARVVVAAGGLPAWVAASLTAAAAAYGEAGSLVAGTALLLVLAAVAGASAWLADRLPAVPAIGLSAAAGLVVAAAWATPVEQVPDRWVPVVLTLVAATLLAAAALLPRRQRAAPAAVTLLAAVAPVLASAEAVIVAVAGSLVWLERPWQGGRGLSARELAADSVLRDGALLGSDSSWGIEVPLLLLLVAAVCVAADRLHRLVPRLELAAVPLVGLAALTAPVALDLSLVGTLALDLTVAGALVLAGAGCLRQSWRQAAAACLLSGLAVLALTVCSSLAVDRATLAVLPVTALVLAAATVLVPTALRVPLGVTAVVAAIAEAGAVARFEGAGWPAVSALTLSLGALAATAAAARVHGVVRRGFAVAATALLLADTVALTVWSGGSVTAAGLAMAVVGGIVLTLGAWAEVIVPSLLPDGRAVAAEVSLTAAAGTAIGVLLAALDADRLWLGLLAAGAAAAAVALRARRHRVGWVAGALLASSTWVRLALSDVEAPEPYTVPGGLALLALGMWRRRRDPSYPSWSAYATGLTLVLVPSLLRAVTDAGNVRPLLLALAALAVLCSGLARRLQAPLVIGGLVLGIDAVVQLVPYLLAVYDAVPRWSLLAAIGLVLVLLGATYERRARELRALQRQIASFG
ncbi:MAG: hypothetical protein QOH75_3916 [Actinomycetota bacterium]|nr:hypothetical protein [Actinomycetota bacterium]